MDWSTTSGVVTGASRGIGRAVVEALVARGAKVGAIARSAEDLEELRRTVTGKGQIVIATADVAVRSEVEAAVCSLRNELGSIDVLVNNAGIGLYGPVASLEPDDAERLMRVNYLGTLYPTLAVLAEMLERRRGAIVNVASIAGRLGAPLEAAYSASKFAVAGFTETLALEAAPFGVKVSMVNPGPVDTGFFAARGHPYNRRSPRPIPPERVASVVIDILEHPRVEATVPRVLRFAALLRNVAPRLYLSATARAFHTELADLQASLCSAKGPAQSAEEKL